MPDINTSFYTQAQPNALLGTAAQATDIRNAQLANAQGQQTKAIQQYNVMNGAIGAIADNPNASYEDFQNLSTLVKQGIVSPDFYAAEMQGIPTQAAPEVYRQIASKYLARGLDAANQFAVATGMAPGSQSDVVSYTGPGGETDTATRGNFVATHGIGANALTQAPPSNPMLAGAPDQPQAPAPASAPGNGTVPSPDQLQPGAVVASPTPADQLMFNDSAKQYTQDKADAAKFQNTMMAPQQIAALLPKTLTGSGSQPISELAKLATTFGIPWGQDQSTNITELSKWANLMAKSLNASDNSDLQLLTNKDSVPGPDMDNKAAQHVADVMLSLGRMKQAMTLASMDDPTVNNNNYSTRLARLGAGLDTRGFSVDLMSPGEKADLSKQLAKDPAAAKRFNAAYDLATKYGLLDAASLGIGNAQ